MKLKLVLSLLFIVVLIGCGAKSKDIEKVDMEAPENLPLVTIEIANFGTIQAELYPHIAPNTVNNFISLIDQGFYDGLTIHRIEKDFVLQGGDPTGTGMGGPGYSIAGEFTSNGFLNELKHTEGVLSMARTSQPDSAGSQFFIMLNGSAHLDGNYAAFGKVISGMEVAHAIEEVGTTQGPIVMTKVTVDTYGIEYPKPEIIQ